MVADALPAGDARLPTASRLSTSRTTVETKRSEASWVACFKMEVAADIIGGRRPHEATG